MGYPDLQTSSISGTDGSAMDMDMTSNSYIECLQELVESGEVPEYVLDEAAGDVLRLKFELGLFDHPYRTTADREQDTLLRPEYRAVAREAAIKSTVLLKNENNVLPLKQKAKVALFGALAADKGQMTGAWAVGAKAGDCVSMVEAFAARGLCWRYCGPDADEAALQAAVETSDVLVAAVGETKEESGEAASRADITVNAEQMTLIRKLASTGKPVIVVLFNGRPLAIPELHELVAAVVEAWHPGVEAGNAILDILCGDVNPSGKLTTTFPAATGQCPMYYAHINTGRPGGKSKFTSKYLDAPIEPLYPFGYGLSYTTYAYTGRKVEKREDGIHVSMSVTNTGGRDGEEIVQCYVQQMTGRRVRPVRQLKDFTKISLKAGETKTVTFVIPYAGLSYYDWEMKEVPGEGIVKVYAGGDSRAELAGQVVLCRASDR